MTGFYPVTRSYALIEAWASLHSEGRLVSQYCYKQLTCLMATLDHVTPAEESGDNSSANLVTACLGCNFRKHKRPVGYFPAEQ